MSGPDRRRFVALAGAAVAGLAVPACASVASVRLPAPDGRLRVRPDAHPALDGPLGSLSVLPDGWDLPIHLVRDERGDLVALSPVCTHLGCVVEVEGRTLACPCHGSLYARDGAVLRGPAERALRRFPTSVDEDGTFVIDVREGLR